MNKPPETPRTSGPNVLTQETTNAATPNAALLATFGTTIDTDNWRRVRSAIEHENNLTNQRFTWLLSLQAYLVAACVGIRASPVLAASETLGRSLGILTVIALLGAACSWFLKQQLHAAYDQHEKLRDWWNTYSACLPKHEHPPICGEDRTQRNVSYRNWSLAMVFTVFWVVAAVFFAWELCSHYSNTGTSSQGTPVTRTI